MPVNRHDILIAFDVTNGNPNGDPDAGNMPRTEPNSGKGLVSDVCLKRKVRNFVSAFSPEATGLKDFKIMVQQGNVLNTLIEKAEENGSENTGRQTTADKDKITALKKEIKELTKAQKTTSDDSIKTKLEGVKTQLGVLAKAPTDDEQAKAAQGWLCRNYYDVRTFGGVVSTGKGVLSGSPHGQIRGPVQFTLGMSVDRILMQEITLTRCAVTKEEDAKKERTMGHKHIVPYGLYVAKAFVSPLFADKTGFDEADLKLFLESLEHLFSNDQSAARAEMSVRAVFDFEHVGTQAASNESQNRRERQLGCAHAHKLFETVRIKRNASSAGTFPAAFTDYDVSVDGWAGGRHADFPGVTLHRLVG